LKKSGATSIEKRNERPLIRGGEALFLLYLDSEGGEKGERGGSYLLTVRQEKEREQSLISRKKEIGRGRVI